MHLAQSISPLEVVLTLLYLAAVAFLGWLGYQRTKTTADYLVAGRKVHPFIMSMSYGATFISTSAIVGFGGVAALFGMSLLWLTFLNIFVGIFIAFVVLGGRTRRMGHRLDAHTFAELLGRRFDSRFIQVMAGLIIFLFMPLYAAAVLMGGTEFLATAFSMPYVVALLVFGIITAIYVFFGGLKGVLYTDALQGSIMVIGMLFLLVWAYVSVGGVAEGHKELASMSDQVGTMKAIGHRGYTATPTFGWGRPADLKPGMPSPYDMWWIVFTTIVLGVGIGVLAQPQLVLRFLTVKSGRELNRALAIGGPFILLMTGVAFTVGALSNAYFFKHEVVRGQLVSEMPADVIIKKVPGKANQTAQYTLMHIDTDSPPDGKADVDLIRPADPADVRVLDDGRVEVRSRASSIRRAVVFDQVEGAWMLNADSIIPTFVTSAMPRWFKIIFLLTLLSAAMSTMSSQYHTLGSAIGRDVIEPIMGSPPPGSNRTIYTVRVGIIIGLIMATLIGYYGRGEYIIPRATAIFFGLCASTFLPTFVGGLFFRRITRPAAIASMLVGFIVTALWLVFVKDAEAGSIGLVRWFTGGANSILAGYDNWPVLDPLLIALPLSTLTVIVVSIFTRAPDPLHLEKCFAASAPGQSAGAATSVH